MTLLIHPRFKQDCKLRTSAYILMIIFQDTLIVWAEADNYDLALSFQEKIGCDEIWEKICRVS